MNKFLLLLSLFIITSFSISCSSDGDENVGILKPEENTNKALIEISGDWKINYVALASDPNSGGDNFFKAYINIDKSGNVEYFDGNNKTFTMKNTDISSGGIDTSIVAVIQSNYQSIYCRKSTKFPGQVEFNISYPSNSGYHNMLLIGTKK